MSVDMAVKFFAQAFTKALSRELPDIEVRPDKRRELPDIEVRPDKRNWKQRRNQFTADDDEPKRRFSPSVGTRASVQRRGRVGMMDVEVLWVGQTSNGMRAKVRENGSTKVFWVDRDKLELYNTLWPVAKGSL